jgi:hypothetical protein
MSGSKLRQGRGGWVNLGDKKIFVSKEEKISEKNKNKTYLVEESSLATVGDPWETLVK